MVVDVQLVLSIWMYHLLEPRAWQLTLTWGSSAAGWAVEGALCWSHSEEEPRKAILGTQWGT